MTTIDGINHGTFSAYNRGCRCDECSARKRSARSARYESQRDNISHGTSYAYNVGCRCDECSSAKRARSQAYYIANKAKIQERNRAWYAANKAQAIATARKWQRANPEKVRGYVAKWTAANPDWERNWVAANPDKVKAKARRHYEKVGLEYHRQWRAANPDKAKAAGDKWRKANPDKVRQRTSTQRFKRKSAETLLVTPEDWRRLCARYRSCCHYCGEFSTALSQDHVIPLARGGRHSIGNIVPACRSCNSSKNARLIVEWVAAKRAA